MDHIARFMPIIREVAARALDQAADGTTTRPAAGKKVASLVEVGVPLGRRLLGDGSADLQPTIAALSDLSVGIADGRGHHRPAYRFVLLSNLWRLFEYRESPAAIAELPMPAFGESMPDQRWAFTLKELQPPCMACLAQIQMTRHNPGPLHEQNFDDAPEDWTFRELVGLHAMTHLATLESFKAIWDAIKSVTAYHQIHTQPDYTTYQPWALAAFVANPETTLFAEQQLHDVTTHLAIEGGPGAVVPALLLADAWFTLNSLSNQ